MYDSRAAEIASRLDRLIDRYREHVSSPDGYRVGELPLNERDAIMTAHGDSIHDGDGSPLSYLLRFLDDEAEGVISGVHVLPFSPGIDYREIDPELGDWADIEAIADDFMLMADLALNDCAVQGPWFQRFLRDELPELFRVAFEVAVRDVEPAVRRAGRGSVEPLEPSEEVDSIVLVSIRFSGSRFASSAKKASTTATRSDRLRISASSPGRAYRTSSFSVFSYSDCRRSESSVRPSSAWKRFHLR